MSARQGNRLSALQIKNATKPGLYSDGHGLALQVSKWGTKSWIFRWQQDGVPHKLGLGPLHTVSLAEARKRAADARLTVLDGHNPIVQRRVKRVAFRAEAAKLITFKECAESYIAANEAGWKNDKHRAQWSATFNETHRGKKRFPAATEAINDLPVSVIDTGLVLKVLEPIWSTRTESASRIRGRIESVLNWATVRNYRSGENPARWRGHLENVLPQRSKVQKVKHHAALPYKDIAAFISELRTHDGVSARALEFTILTATRTGETIGATWDEIDFEELAWIIAATRMKAGREHRIPLCDRAIEILDGLPREGKFVFIGAAKGRPLSNMAMLELLRGMRVKGLTVHGFRSTFRDWAAERTAHPNHVVEAALAHVVADKTEAAYRRGDLFEKRRRLMEDWAGYCGGNVMSIRQAVA